MPSKSEMPYNHKSLTWKRSTKSMGYFGRSGTVLVDEVPTGGHVSTKVRGMDSGLLDGRYASLQGIAGRDTYGDQAAVFVCRKSVNIGMGLNKSRAAMIEIEAAV